MKGLLLIALLAAPRDALPAALEPPLVLNCSPVKEGGDREERPREGLPRFLSDRPFSPERGYGFERGEGFRTLSFGIWGGPGGVDLFTSGRVDPGSYRFALPEGRYVVALGLCEMREHLPGRRLFDVLLQGETAIESLDPFAIAGFGQAFRIARTAEVRGGEGLTVSFLGRSAAAPLVNAIWIDRSSEGAGPPRPPAGLRGLGSYRMNVLFWRHREDGFLQGYLVERRGPGDEEFTPRFHRPTPAARWIDREVSPGASYRYRLRSVDLEGRRSEPGEAISLVPRALEQSSLPFYSLEVSPEGLADLLMDVKKDRKVKGSFAFQGESHPVKVRVRGASTRNAAKLSWRIRFNRDSPFPRRTIYLKAEPFDHTLQAEKLTCDVFADLGLPVSQASHVNLSFNGEYQGVYLDIEPVDRAFKSRPDLQQSGNLIRASSFQQLGRPAGTPGGRAGAERLAEFIRGINRVDRGDFEAFVRSATDWPKLLDYLVATEVCHRSEIEAEDFFYYRDPLTSRWLLIPWDMNNGNFGVRECRNELGRPFIPLFGQTLQGVGLEHDWWYVLPSRIFDDDRLRREYLDRLEKVTRDILLSGRIDGLIDANHDRICQEASADPFRWPPGLDEPFENSPRDLRRFAREHGERLLDLIARERAREPLPVVVSEFEFGSQRGWVELHNRSGAPVCLEGHSLAAGAGLRGPRHRLSRSDVLEPGAFKVFEFERLEAGSEGLFRGFDPRGGFLALLGPAPPEGPRERFLDWYYYGPQTEGFSYGRSRSGVSFGFLRPTPGRENDAEVLHPPPLLSDGGVGPSSGSSTAVNALISAPAGGGSLPRTTFILHYLREGKWEEAPMTLEGIRPEGEGVSARAKALLEGIVISDGLSYYFVARSPEGLERFAPLTAPAETYRWMPKDD